MGILSEFINWLPGYFFPKICYGCGREGAYVCEECRKTVERVLDEPRCSECGREAAFGATHPGCRRKYGLDGLISYYKYAGWAKEIVKEAKFGKHHRWAGMKELAGEMARVGRTVKQYNGKTVISKTVTGKPVKQPTVSLTYRSTGYRFTVLPFHRSTEDWIIVPIPLHWWREFKRGFNQAELIAGELAAGWNIPMIKMLIRKQYTEPQTLTEKEIKLTKEQEEKLEEKYRSTLQRDYAGKKLLNKLKAKRRKENIKNAFGVRLEVKGQRLELNGINVLLVDDVWTSGATMKECCRVLKRAGVKRVWGVTLLRT